MNPRIAFRDKRAARFTMATPSSPGALASPRLIHHHSRIGARAKAGERRGMDGAPRNPFNGARVSTEEHV